MKPLDLVVSITSWRGRIGSEIVRENIFRLLRQKTDFSYIVTLVLSSDEFPRREAELPETLVMMAEKEPMFRIVWVKENTRALKKLSGAQMAYPDLPVLTTDDDIAVKDSFVDDFMRCHMEHPKDIISPVVWTPPHGVEITGWARLYPVGSVAQIPDCLFMKFFRGLEDDVYNGLRSVMAGSHHRKLSSWPFEAELNVGTALRDEYLKTNVNNMVFDFVNGWRSYLSH